MFKYSTRILQGAFEFIECLIARKIVFKVNLSFNWKKLKSGSRIVFFNS